MGRPKKIKKRGRKISAGSTPPYSLLSPKSRLFYHNCARAKNRGQEPPTPQSTSRGQSASVPGQIQQQERQAHAEQGQRGRPPLNLEAGPMSPGSLGARRKELGKINLIKKKISDARHQAFLMRADRQGGGGGGVTKSA